jgi:hypothetical protein
MLWYVAACGFSFSEFPNHLCISQVDLLGAGLTRRKVSTVLSSEQNRFGRDSPQSGLLYEKNKQDRQCTYDVTLRCVRATIVVVQKQ